MLNWEPIFTEASQANTKLVYFGIGSAMGRYSTDPIDPNIPPGPNNTQLTDDTNQQYPPFLNKFEGKKLIILLDPCLEEHLAVEKYMEAHGMRFEKYAVDNICVLRNDEVVVYAIKENFNYNGYLWGTSEEIKQSIHKSDWDIANMIYLIGICLQKRTKIILQDFTGRDTTGFYYSLFDIFDKTSLLNDVMFDVTQKDGGCFIQLNKDQASVDSDGNFIQEKYLELFKITESSLFKSILKERIQQVIYPISHNFVSLKKDPAHEIVNKGIFLSLAHTYDIDVNENNNDPDYLIEKHIQLIQKVLEDIVIARDLDSSTASDLISVIDQRTTFINSMTTLKFDLK